MHIVLLEPEIPQNTGNIARTCAVTGSILHLIRPLGFTVTDRHLRRAGMDYWKDMDIRYHDSFDDFIASEKPMSAPNAPMFLSTTKARQTYAQVSYKDGSYIVFGKESMGIPEETLVKYQNSCIRIPMLDSSRSLNLSASVAIVLYEALRQNNFAGLESKGRLHRLNWTV